jgi:predicted DNA-binding protein (MmcQ/YjbR family)
MDYNHIKDYLLRKKGAKQDFPFDAQTLVIKVMGKMFALIALDQDPLWINLKCDPDKSEALRALYPSIIPGYHMNKRHWNSVILDGSIPQEVVLEMIDESYDLVVRSLKKTDRQKLAEHKEK